MRVTPEVVELERQLVRKRAAMQVLLSADAYERWGPKGNIEERQRIEREADAAGLERRAASAEIDARVAVLREEGPEHIAAWAAAHVELLDAYLESVGADTTEASVAREERAAWARLPRSSAQSHVEQNTHYVRYDRERYAALFGFEF